MEINTSVSEDGLTVELGYKQRNYRDEQVCGDTVVYQYLADDRRLIVVLADGMGHGESARKLSEQASGAIIEAIRAGKKAPETGREILKRFSATSGDPYNYSTFTLLDIDLLGLRAGVLNHDNPASLVIRDGLPLQTDWTCLVMTEPGEKEQTVLVSRFGVEAGDRIVLVTDGVSKSGLNSEKYPFGWGNEGIAGFIGRALVDVPALSAQALAEEVVSEAVGLDEGVPKDDMSCVVIYFRTAE